MYEDERNETMIDTAQLHEMALLFETALGYIRGLQSDAIQEGLHRAGRSATTQFDIVSEVLSQVDSTGLFVSEIAEASGIPQASVRMVLYSNKYRFDAERLSPRRIRWRLNNEDTNPSRLGCEIGEAVGV